MTLAAVLALLLAPSPTNTLMGVAGAQGGLGRVTRLIPTELLGYLITILPLALLGGQMLERWPAAALALKLAAAVWVMVLAVRLWGLRGHTDAARRVTAPGVLVTTMLNPKALIFGLVLLPEPGDPSFAPRLGMFCAMVITVALIWGMAGWLTQRDGGGTRLQLVQRIASVWLACISLTLIAVVVRA